MNEHVLIIEDDKGMQSYLSTLLRSHHHPISCFDLGLDAMNSLTTHEVDLILLDLGLEDIDGQEWLASFRSWSDIPVLVISARHQEGDKVTALDNGANDYITKPFSSAELMARVRVALRHSRSGKTVFQFGDVEVNPVAREVSRGGERVHLTKIEYQILLLLLKNVDKVLTHNFILEQVWGKAYTGRPEYIRVHIGQLRQKLEANPAAPEFIKTEAGVGYRLKSQ